ncbi:MAG: hypothetical protein FIB06_04890 [Betaproteobacteria bacterium]|nr:hypothetical protein [Betaproteobacteria bacterium]
MDPAPAIPRSHSDQAARRSFAVPSSPRARQWQQRRLRSRIFPGGVAHRPHPRELRITRSGQVRSEEA